MASRLLAVVLALTLTVACTSNVESESSSRPKDRLERAEVTDEAVVEARVDAVDSQERLVTLRRADGSTFVVMCGPEVRNFAQIAVGDRVQARYVRTLIARIVTGAEAEADPTLAIAAGRAAEGDRPGIGVGGELVIVVTIESVDTERCIVTFSSEMGGLEAIHATRPEGQAFVRGLVPGDKVELTIRDAAAISVVK